MITFLAFLQASLILKKAFPSLLTLLWCWPFQVSPSSLHCFQVLHMLSLAMSANIFPKISNYHFNNIMHQYCQVSVWFCLLFTKCCIRSPLTFFLQFHLFHSSNDKIISSKVIQPTFNNLELKSYFSKNLWCNTNVR